ncbi:MAG: hypothetical protein RL517_1017, partial [Pseudomonadota bacterium]
MKVRILIELFYHFGHILMAAPTRANPLLPNTKLAKDFAQK